MPYGYDQSIQLPSSPIDDDFFTYAPFAGMAILGVGLVYVALKNAKAHEELIAKDTAIIEAMDTYQAFNQAAHENLQAQISGYAPPQFPQAPSYGSLAASYAPTRAMTAPPMASMPVGVSMPRTMFQKPSAMIPASVQSALTAALARV